MREEDVSQQPYSDGSIPMTLDADAVAHNIYPSPTLGQSRPYPTSPQYEAAGLSNTGYDLSPHSTEEDAHVNMLGANVLLHERVSQYWARHQPPMQYSDSSMLDQQQPQTRNLMIYNDTLDPPVQYGPSTPSRESYNGMLLQITLPWLPPSTDD
jgi:hypothetical protein